MNKNGADKIVFKSFDPFSQFEIVKQIWISLLEKCPHSYYLSWAETEIWIKRLPPDCQLTLVVGLIGESPVIAFFLGSKTTQQHKFFKFRKIALNQTLIPDIDATTYIEYNSVLIDPEFTFSLESLLDHLPVKLWDELVMVRCSSLYQPNLTFNKNLNKKYNISKTKYKSYYVDLDKFRRNNNDYLALLSHKKRNLIRRSIREYEKMGGNSSTYG